MSSTSRDPRGGGRSERLVEVELVDGSASAPDRGVDDASRAPARPDHRALRLVGRWWRPVVIGLVVALAATSVIADRREAARQAAFADVPGVASPLDGPVHPLWTSSLTSWTHPMEMFGTIVAATSNADGGSDVVALDGDTGVEAWRVPLARADPNPGPATVGSTCTAVTARPRGAQVRPLVACLASLSRVDNASSGTSTLSVTATRLALIDATSGAIVSDTPTVPSTAIGRVGTDLVRAVLTSSGHLQVVRTDPLGATPRWTFTSPDVPSASADSWLAIDVVDDRILVATPTAWWVLSADGTLIRTRDGTEGSFLFGFTGRELLMGSTSSTGAATRTSVLDLATGTSFSIPGAPAGATPDDLSLPDVILTLSSGTLVASDALTGASRWSTRLGDQSQVMVIGGRVVIDEAGSLRSIDGRSGTVQWDRKDARTTIPKAVTDGTVLVSTSTAANNTTVMTAYGLDDGATRWTVNVPLIMSVDVLGNRIVTLRSGSATITAWG